MSSIGGNSGFGRGRGGAGGRGRGRGRGRGGASNSGEDEKEIATVTSTSAVHARGRGRGLGRGRGRGAIAAASNHRKRGRVDPDVHNESEAEADGDSNEDAVEEADSDTEQLVPSYSAEEVEAAESHVRVATASGNKRTLRRAVRDLNRMYAARAERQLLDADAVDREREQAEDEEMKHSEVQDDPADEKLSDEELVATEPIIIALYAEKGGVGKTTLTSNLSYMLASQGHRVLVYDCDAQRSLTAWMFGVRIRAAPFNGDVSAFIAHVNAGEDGTAPRTLYDQFTQAYSQQGVTRAARATKLRHNLWVVPGHRLMKRIDERISNTEALFRAGLVGTNHVTGSLYHSVRATARAYRCQYVLLDLNPSAGTFNRTMIMACSHYLMVPAIADFFSTESMRELRGMLQEWVTEIDSIVVSAQLSACPIAPHRTKFLGYVLNRYIPTNGGTIVDGVATDTLRLNEENWALQVRTAARAVSLANPLAISQAVYAHVHRSNLLGKIREFWGLGDLSDNNLLPVPFLRRGHMRKERAPPRGSEAMARGEADEKLIMVAFFRQIFSEIVNTITQIIQQDRHVNPLQVLPL